MNELLKSKAKMVPNEAGVQVLCVSTSDLNDVLPYSLNAKDMTEKFGLVPHARIKNGLWWPLDYVPTIVAKVQEEAARVLGVAKRLDAQAVALIRGEDPPPWEAAAGGAAAVSSAPAPTAPSAIGEAFTRKTEHASAEEIAVAREAFCAQDDIAVDDDALVSRADGGVWVQAWLWLEETED